LRLKGQKGLILCHTLQQSLLAQAQWKETLEALEEEGVRGPGVLPAQISHSAMKHSSLDDCVLGCWNQTMHDATEAVLVILSYTECLAFHSCHRRGRQITPTEMQKSLRFLESHG